MGGSQKTECARLNPRTQKSSQEAPDHLLHSSLRSVEENWEGPMTFASWIYLLGSLDNTVGKSGDAEQSRDSDTCFRLENTE